MHFSRQKKYFLFNLNNFYIKYGYLVILNNYFITSTLSTVVNDIKLLNRSFFECNSVNKYCYTCKTFFKFLFLMFFCFLHLFFMQIKFIYYIKVLFVYIEYISYYFWMNSILLYLRITFFHKTSVSLLRITCLFICDKIV